MGVYSDYLKKNKKTDDEVSKNVWVKNDTPTKTVGVTPIVKPTIKFSTPNVLTPKLPSQVNTPVKQYNTPISTKPNPYLQVARPITNNISL